MELNLTDVITKIANTNIFQRNENTNTWETGTFVGRPYYLDYERAYLLISDFWKNQAKGVPQGAFLLAYYEDDAAIAEALLLRVLRPSGLPTDSDVVKSMIEYYKDNLNTSGTGSQLDTYTRYEFSFSGLECRILGTLYIDKRGRDFFGADVENFYSAHHYSVIKPNDEVLKRIVNFREGGVTGKPTDIQIGRVRYSSSRRFQVQEDPVTVYVSPKDFLGKRTALFGMTRTGKSNTVKKIIQATVLMSRQAPVQLPQKSEDNGQASTAMPLTEQSAAEANLEPFTDEGMPKYPVGQIIFDINGEYANANMQDEGTAIFQVLQDQVSVSRYSVLEKPGFKMMKVNFYRDIHSGFELTRSHLANDTADYVRSFVSIDLTEPSDKKDFSAQSRYQRKKAAYLCCLYKAGLTAPKGFTVTFPGEKTLNSFVQEDGNLDPGKGISLEDATNWFTIIWERYNDDFFQKYQKQKGHEWADEDLKALLVFLTRKPKPGGNTTNSGYIKLRDLARLHTQTVSKPFEKEIVDELRQGHIIIVDLSQGEPDIQQLYSERITRQLFADAMERFIGNRPNNFIQFYFEEAHNLFPKKEDKDLSQIYNRIAKEGAKLNLGMVYATQEVSSISSNILKNTQNWFIAHLNNEDETKEIKKYYDFGDFTDSLVRFSASSDRGFVRMKTYSNPFVVPVQIDRFPKNVDQEGA